MNLAAMGIYTEGLGCKPLQTPSGEPRTTRRPQSQNFGRLICMRLQCCEALPFFTIQRQRRIKLRVLRAQDFYTPLALNCQKGQCLAALEVYKNQSRRIWAARWPQNRRIAGHKATRDKHPGTNLTEIIEPDSRDDDWTWKWNVWGGTTGYTHLKSPPTSQGRKSHQ